MGNKIGSPKVVDALADGLFGGTKIPDLIEALKHVDGEFRHEGAVWVISLNDAQTKALRTVLLAGGGSLALVCPFFVEIAPILAACSGYIEAVNRWGGENGVDINGVLGARGVIVTPRLGGLFGQLIKAARVEASGMAIIEYVMYACSRVPLLADALNMTFVSSVFTAVAAGTPLGWAIAGALGLIVRLFDPEPDPNQHGAVMADRTQVGPWESFMLAREGNHVALLSHRGLFSAQMGGGAGVYANRVKLGDWEKWTIIENGDGTVSLQTIGGHYLCAETGGGRECQANRTAIGAWEKFFLETLPGGLVALKTCEKRLYVSVQL